MAKRASRTQQCTTCGKAQRIAQFPRFPDGSYASYCKTCGKPRALRVEIARPLGELTWGDLGEHLRALQTMANWAMNASVDACSLAESRGLDRTAIQNAAYPAASAAVEQWRAWHSRHHEPRMRARAELSPGGGVLGAWSHHGYQAWRRWAKTPGGRWSARRPSFARGAPIMVRRQEVRIFQDARAVCLSMRLLAKGTAQHVVALMPSRGSHWAMLKQIANGTAPHGDVKIVYDDRAKRRNGKRGKWYAIIAYTPPPVDKQTGGGTLAVHRGMHNFLYCVASTGRDTIIVSGRKLRWQKRMLEARAHERQDAIKRGEIGRGARGHGRRRRFRAVSVIKDKLARVITTACHGAGMRVVEVARQWGCTTVAIEDYGGIGPDADEAKRRYIMRFPFHELKQAILWACEKAGLTVVEVPSHYISSICPDCGNKDEAQHNLRTGMFRCTACDLKRRADYVAGVHMLRRAGADMSYWDRGEALVNELAATAKVLQTQTPNESGKPNGRPPRRRPRRDNGSDKTHV